MRQPWWIRKPLALAIHEQFLAGHGGESGLRDESLLDSALTAPLNRYHSGERDIIALAAAYAHALVRNLPFNDGNKSVAFVLAVTFIEMNGYRMNAPESEAFER
jgi:death-on-curing protein